MVKVTIITVCLNAEKTIERTIKSVIEQAYPNLQYVVIDGGSVDKTVDLIDKYSWFVSVFISEKDKGISEAFNKGLNFAKGDLIGIINSDDWYEPEAIQRATKVFSDYKNEIIHSDTFYWLSQEKRGMKYSLTLGLNFPLFGCTIRHPSCFIPKLIYEKIGFYNENLKICMDYEFFIRCKQNKINFIKSDKVLVNYSSGGASKIFRWKILREEFSINRNVRNINILVCGAIFIIRLAHLYIFEYLMVQLLLFSMIIQKQINSVQD